MATSHSKKKTLLLSTVVIAFILVQIEEIATSDPKSTGDDDKIQGGIVDENKKNKKDNGGWSIDPELVLTEPGPCNIEVRDKTMTQAEFLSDYAYKVPVIIKESSDNSKFREACSKQQLLEKYGDNLIRLSSANTYSYLKVDVTLRKYIMDILKPQKIDTLGNETLYWFGDNNYTEWESLFAMYKPPPYRLPHHTGAYSFGLAGAGTGVPFHFHGPGFGEVIYGRKRWFFYPPNQRPNFHPNITTLQWVLEDYPKLYQYQLPYECTIGPGEAIYFPDHWWHGTLNIDTSVFISTFLSP